MRLPKIEIQNIVATVKFCDERINLEKLAMKLKNSEYAPEQFPGLIYRNKTTEPKSTFLIFSSGIMTSTGTRSVKDLHKAIKNMINLLKRNRIKVKAYETTVQNIVASSNLERRIDLDRLLKLENVEYEPASFPGMVYRTKFGITFLLFHTGKIIIAGSKNTEEMEKALDELIKTFKDERILK